MQTNPGNEKGRRAGNTAAPMQTAADFAGTATDQQALILARAARAGWVITTTAGSYIVSRRGMSRTLPDLAAVDAFLRRAGVKP